MCVAFIGLIAGIPCFIVACLPLRWRRDNRIYFFFSNIFYKGVTWATLLPVTIKGRDNIPQESVIFAPNHLSALDIPFIGYLIGNNSHIWLFLKKYAYVPIFGFIASRMNIIIDLSSPRALMRALKQAIVLGKQKKRHIVIFPEGGRARNGKIQNFFAGFAMIAEKTGLPVVPIRLYNLDKVFPPGAFLIREHPVTVIIGKPMQMREGETRELFVERVRAWFEHPQHTNE